MPCARNGEFEILNLKLVPLNNSLKILKNAIFSKFLCKTFNCKRLLIRVQQQPKNFEIV